MTATDPVFHVGEQQAQERVGVRETMASWGRKVVRTWMPDQHREFYHQLPFVVAAARDGRGRPWATVLSGRPGFIRSPDPGNLIIAGNLLPGDALGESLVAGTQLALLGIELATRRRNRVNGTVVESSAASLRLKVGQSFGNCPQYITEREWRTVDVDPAKSSSMRRADLSSAQQQWIRDADTFFIGSGYAGNEAGEASGMDASHRGGPPGFVSVETPTRLVFPDYAGNNHFNTIGNLLVDPRVALLFVDFERGGLLQLTGRARVEFDPPANADYPGAQRLVRVDIEEIVERRGVLPLRFSEPKGIVRELRLVERRRESDDVVSFWFTSRDGGELPDFAAGQHLPLEFRIAGYDRPVTRTYSLSNGPGQGYYRISVKREPGGLVSRFLHDTVETGAVLNSHAPTGSFVPGRHDRPIVLLSAGIGVTPMVSMLQQLAAIPTDRPVAFLHGAHDGRHHPFADEVRMIAAKAPNVTLRVAYSQPSPDDEPGRDYDVAGRIDERFVRDAVPWPDADYFVCGPAPFLAAMSDVLARLGVAETSVHIEQF